MEKQRVIRVKAIKNTLRELIPIPNKVIIRQFIAIFFFVLVAFISSIIIWLIGLYLIREIIGVVEYQNLICGGIGFINNN